MNAAKHTPGPWGYKEVPYHAMSTRHQFQVWAPKGSLDGLTNYFVATIDDFNAEPCNEANARLISAAPEMLVSMEEALSLLEFYSKRDMNAPANNQEAVRETSEMLERYRAAIRKARGTK